MATAKIPIKCGSDDLRALYFPRGQATNPLYGRYADPRQIGENALQNLLGSVASGDAEMHTTRNRGELTGVATWRMLAWDTEQLGMVSARIEAFGAAGAYVDACECYATLLTEVAKSCRSRGVSFLAARVEASDSAAIHSLEAFGFNLVDSIQTFSLDLSTFRAGTTDPRIRSFEDRDLTDVLEIAGSSYVCDRFHSDPVIGLEKANGLHRAWLRNSCRGIGCDQVMVGVDEVGVTSYVTCQIDRQQREATGLAVGTIVMVATAARVRGQGWALAVTFGALEWFRQQEVQVVVVGTQLRNIGAASLYQRAGFRPTGASFTFRKLLA